MPGFPVLHCLPEFVKLLSIELVMPSNHLLLCPLMTLSKSHQFTNALPPKAPHRELGPHIPVLGRQSVVHSTDGFILEADQAFKLEQYPLQD